MASNISPQEQLKAQTWLIRNFPQLTYDSKFCVTSPVTAVYNCIAWAMGLNDRWVDPAIYIPGHWWPPIPERDLNPDSLVKAFEYMGFIQALTGTQNLILIKWHYIKKVLIGHMRHEYSWIMNITAKWERLGIYIIAVEIYLKILYMVKYIHI